MTGPQRRRVTCGEGGMLNTRRPDRTTSRYTTTLRFSRIPRTQAHMFQGLQNAKQAGCCGGLNISPVTETAAAQDLRQPGVHDKRICIAGLWQRRRHTKNKQEKTMYVCVCISFQPNAETVAAVAAAATAAAAPDVNGAGEGEAEDSSGGCDSFDSSSADAKKSPAA